MDRSFSLNLILLVSLLFLYSCKSPLSNGKLSGLSELDVRIEISQDPTDKTKNEVALFLYDTHGRPIRNKDIKMEVNDVGLTYNERQELYYTTSSRYMATDVPVSDGYKFHITLSDGRSYFLGSIAALAQSNEADIVCDNYGKFDKDFVISWKNLKGIDSLAVTKEVLLATSTKIHQNYDYQPLPGRRIGSSGKYVVPRSAYITKESTISGLEVKFVTNRTGKMNPQLAEGSRIKISGQMERSIDFDEQQQR
jgi:hypothetical protein